MKWNNRTVLAAVVTAITLAMLVNPAVADVTVNPGDSSEPWLGFMNVFELDGTTFVFGSPWGIPDLAATFDDGAGTITLAPNSIPDPDPFWYIGGMPGAPGNKTMDANLYQEFPPGTLAGQTLTFEGMVLSNTFTDAHSSKIFIREFAPDFSSFVEESVPVAPGPFSISLAISAGQPGFVQYGLNTFGVNVWITDVEPFGTAVIGTGAVGAVPTVSEWGLIIMTLLLLTAGTIVFGRRNPMIAGDAC